MGERFEKSKRSLKDLKEEGFYKFGIDLSDTVMVIKEMEKLLANNLEAQAGILKNLSDEYSRLSPKKK